MRQSILIEKAVILDRYYIGLQYAMVHSGLVHLIGSKSNMHQKIFIMIAFIFGAQCTTEKRNNSVDSQLFAVQKCSSDGIAACTKADGGKDCFERCGMKPSARYCRMEELTKCIEKGGSPGCYKEQCGRVIGGNGLFRPANGPGLTTLPAQGFGFEAFDVDWMRYGQPKTIARIKELAARTYARTGFMLYIGDLSDSSGGNSGRHVGHGDGLEVDIAIMGNTPSVKCYNYWDDCYNRDAQIALIEEVIEMGGASGILFNDPAVQARFPYFVSNAAGHHNHIHINWH